MLEPTTRLAGGRTAVVPALGNGRWQPRRAGENWLLPQGDEARAERLPNKCTVKMQAGDVIRVLTAGGGGWGSPDTERP